MEGQELLHSLIVEVEGFFPLEKRLIYRHFVTAEVVRQILQIDVFSEADWRLLPMGDRLELLPGLISWFPRQATLPDNADLAGDDLETMKFDMVK